MSENYFLPRSVSSTQAHHLTLYIQYTADIATVYMSSHLFISCHSLMTQIIPFLVSIRFTKPDMVRTHSLRSCYLSNWKPWWLYYIILYHPTNKNVSELETECVLIQFPLSFNNTKPVVLFTLHQSQSLEGIFLLEQLPWCDTWAM